MENLIVDIQTDILNVASNAYTQTLAAKLDMTPHYSNRLNLLVNGATFREDTTYQGDISNLAPLCTKYVAYTIGGRPEQPIEVLGVDYFPDILNAEIDVLLDLEKEIQCNINVGHYATYKAICVGIENYLATDYTDWTAVYEDYYPRQMKVLRDNLLGTRIDPALQEYNETNIDAILSYNALNVSLPSDKTNVLLSLGVYYQEMGMVGSIQLPIKASLVENVPVSPAMPSNISSGPFNPASFINNNSAIQIFTN